MTQFFIFDVHQSRILKGHLKLTLTHSVSMETAGTTYGDAMCFFFHNDLHTSFI